MNLLKLMLLMALVMIGLLNRPHSKHQSDVREPGRAPSTAVDKEILQNAERLTETLRRCNQTAHKNKEIQ